MLAWVPKEMKRVEELKKGPLSGDQWSVISHPWSVIGHQILSPIGSSRGGTVRKLRSWEEDPSRRFSV